MRIDSESFNRSTIDLRQIDEEYGECVEDGSISVAAIRTGSPSIRGATGPGSPVCSAINLFIVMVSW